jgi:PPOX class probable F420-dependent enzyme
VSAAENSPPAPPASHADLLERALFAHVATVRPDGTPQSSVMWFAWDGTHLRLTHSRTGQKFRNLRAEPHVAVSVADPANPYRSLEIRGRLETVENDPDGAFFGYLARRYDSPVRLTSSLENRVTLMIRPTRYVTVGPSN